jgi:electron transfer flavoprotein beta subunit
MNIVVCMKETPDTTAEKRFTADLRLDRAAVPGVINPYDEYGIEEALAQKDKLGGEVTLLCMAPARAEESIRKALAMGVDKAVLITDPALEGSDLPATARVLAAALKKLQFDIIIFGQGSTDSNGGMMVTAVAELLGLPALTWASKLTIEASKAVIKRAHETGYDVVEAPLPCVVSVTQVINVPRYPSLKGIMQAKRKELTTYKLADLGIEASSVGSAGAGTKVEAANRVVLNRTPEIFKDPERAAVYIADYLEKRKLI